MSIHICRSTVERRDDRGVLKDIPILIYFNYTLDNGESIIEIKNVITMFGDEVTPNDGEAFEFVKTAANYIHGGTIDISIVML